MGKNRCKINPFAYCEDPKRPMIRSKLLATAGGVRILAPVKSKQCTKDPHTCGYCRSWVDFVYVSPNEQRPV